MTHGTLTRYKSGRCRCTPCRDANSTYARNLRRAHAYGRPPLIDAEPVRTHIAELRAQGIGLRRIAKTAGLRLEVIEALAGYRGPTIGRTCRPDTATAILAVTPTHTPDGIAERRPVPAVGTRRRVQALMRVGYSAEAIGRAAGLTGQAIGRAAKPDRPTVGRITHERVTLAFDRLDPLGPTPNGPAEAGQIAGRIARATAARWAPPLAWDDPDDPDERPKVRRR